MATIGDHVARIRRALPLTQEALAESAGVSVETIRKLEQGERQSARMSTLNAIARALDVPTTALLGDASTAAARAEPDHRPLSLMDLRRALTPARGLDGSVVAGPDVDPPPLDAVRADLRAVDRAYHANDYATALAALPGLLDGARAAAAEADDVDRGRAYALVARSHHLTGNLLIQLRAGDLAYRALTAALDAAEESGDQVVGATVLQGMTWLLLRQGRFGEAEQLAVSTADRIEPRFSRATPDELAAWGWLLMGAAAAAARDNRTDAAVELIDSAAAAAVRIGERSPGGEHLMMVGGFGVARVEMQRVETAAVAGEPGRVLALAGRVPPGETAVSSSWNRHQLDVAWAHAELGQPREATEVLSEIRRSAAPWLRHQRYARDIVRTLADSRRRAMSRELADLASLVGAGS